MVKKTPLFKTKHSVYHYPLLCGGALLWCLDLYINCFQLIYSQRDATAGSSTCLFWQITPETLPDNNIFDKSCQFDGSGIIVQITYCNILTQT